MRLIKLGLFVVLTLMVLTAVPVLYVAPVVQAQQFGLRFNLDVVPAKVPADGGTYMIYVSLVDSQGNPAAAPSDLSVALFSSDQRVGSVQPTTTISFDTFSASATFTSTNTPGSTVITALASGIQAGTMTVTTTTPVGYPSQIVVYPLPSVLIPGGGETGSLVVQLQDPNGLPARSPAILPVQLTSSDTNVVTVPSSVSIQQGSTYATAAFSPTSIPGNAIVSATSPGYLSGSTTITVSGPAPSSIKVDLLPRVMIADGVSTGYVVVSLTDPLGFPARAKSPVSVVLTSSNTSVAWFDSPDLTIPAGSFYSFKLVHSGGYQGVTIITAQSSGLSAGFGSLVSRMAGIRADGEVIDLSIGPSAVLPDGATYAQIVSAQLLNQTDGYPIPISSSSAVTVYFSSSDTLYGSITSPGVITNNSTYVLADFTSTLLVGSTTITAAADGYAPAQKSVGSSAPPPANIVLGVASSVIRATGEIYPLLYVQLRDQNGNPAKAPADIQVSLISADPAVGTADSSIIIHQGSSYSVASFFSTTSAGTANITASATGFNPTWTLVQTTEPFPSVLAVYARPSPMISDGSNHFAAVQLLDDQGRPAKPELPVTVFLTSDTPNVATTQTTVTLNAGASYATALLTLGATGSAVITAIAQGYSSGSSQVIVSTLPMALSLNITAGHAVVGSSYPVTLSATSGAASVGGALVSASSRTGQFATSSGLTNLNGVLSLTYQPKAPGSDNLTFTVSKAGFSTASASVVLTVDAYYTVTVVVTDEGGVGISGVAVQLRDPKGYLLNATTDGSGNAVFTNVFWGTATATLPQDFQSSSAKYTFMSFADGDTTPSRSVTLLADTTLTAKYQTFFQVIATSPFGVTTGSNFYPRGSTATVSVDPISVPNGFLGLVSKKFTNWMGASTAATPQVQITVDSAKTLTAAWGDDYTLLIIVVVAVAAVIAGVVGFIWFLRKRRAAAPPAEEEFK